MKKKKISKRILITIVITNCFSGKPEEKQIFIKIVSDISNNTSIIDVDLNLLIYFYFKFG